MSVAATHAPWTVYDTLGCSVVEFGMAWRGSWTRGERLAGKTPVCGKSENQVGHPRRYTLYKPRPANERSEHPPPATSRTPRARFITTANARLIGKHHSLRREFYSTLIRSRWKSSLTSATNSDSECQERP